MSRPRTSTLLLLALPIVLLCTPPTSAHRVQKGGCLNYGHSCLGAHGKRASWQPNTRPSTPSRPPMMPRPFLDIILNSFPTPTRTNTQYPPVYASANSALGRRARFPESGVQTVLSDPTLDVKMGGVARVLGGLSDDLETLGGSMDDESQVRSSGNMDQDAVFYDGSFDDDYTDTRYKRNTSPQFSRGRQATTADKKLPKAAAEQNWKQTEEKTVSGRGGRPMEKNDLAGWLMR
ncbi:uncharacterized protein [Panulirus ornatus]|uniref:uncharacterized protein isoform X2 n=1 Tax=Panulirus ornatus TaxID=150431 RepID=UPI003A84369F